jgi:orsellinic acid C2-O-methyltransferase
MNALAEPLAAGAERAQVLDMINASWTTQAIRSACELRLPELLAAGAADAQAVAERAGAHAPALQRLLRALVTLSLCTEDDRGRFALTPGGRLLCEDHPQSVRAWALLAGGVIWQRWGELDDSVRSGLSHRRRHGGDDAFDDLSSNPAVAAQFYRAMVEMTRTVAAAVAQAIDATGVRQVVDVGGGSGELIARVLAAHPQLHGVLFDLPQGLDGATAVLEAAGVAARCTRVAGSFFDGVPEGADLYLLKSVLHNWDDARCVQILQRCRAAMAPRGRVVVLERVMAERVGTSAHDRAVARSDLNMLVALSGRERTFGDYAALCRSAGLALQAGPATAGEFSILQALAR